MSTVTRKQAGTLPGERVVGYVRLGAGDPQRLPEPADEVKAFAEQRSLVLGTVFAERQCMAPALERPALRTIFDVVRYLRPSGLVILTTWNLSGGEVELTSLLRTLAGLNCRVFTTYPAKAAVAVGLVLPRGER